LRDFLLDVGAANRATTTVEFYRIKCSIFITYLKTQGIHDTDEIQPIHIRGFLAELAKKHSPGGVHAFWRGIRAFIRFMQREGILDDDPLRNVRAPSVDRELLEPLSLEVLDKLLATCEKSERGLRDRAILLTLLDTGLRASEALRLNLGDLDLSDGAVLVRKSKSRRPRTVFVGRQTRRAIAAYLRTRPDASENDPLWLACRTDGETVRLAYAGLVALVRRRAKRAGVEPPSLHSFRRTFALTMLRGGADVVSLSRLMGHADLSVLTRYLKQQAEDLARVHEQCSPVDRLRRQSP